MIKTLVTTTAAIAMVASTALGQTPAPAPAPAPAAAPAAAACATPAARPAVATTGAPAATPAAAPAAAPAGTAVTNASCAGGKLTTSSSIRAVFANEKAKAVLTKHIPVVVDYVDQNGLDAIPDDFTLDSLLDVPEAGVDATILKAIGEDLAKL